MRGIYIHIPFCRKICNYCDFYKMVVSDGFKKEYINYLIEDLKYTINKYDLKEVLDACHYYYEQTGRRITFEYSLVGGVNDTKQDAE